MASATERTMTHPSPTARRFSDADVSGIANLIHSFLRGRMLISPRYLDEMPDAEQARFYEAAHTAVAIASGAATPAPTAAREPHPGSKVYETLRRHAEASLAPGGSGWHIRVHPRDLLELLDKAAPTAALTPRFSIAPEAAEARTCAKCGRSINWIKRDGECKRTDYESPCPTIVRHTSVKP